MNLSDYTIDCSSVDWPQLLQNWHWRLPPTFTVWMVNKFADLFLVFEDGSVHWLRTDDGTLQRVAASREEFCTLIEDEENLNDWLMVSLVDRLSSAGLQLKQGQCYGYTFSPIAGGDYDQPNIRAKTIENYIPFLGYFYEQIKDLPEGAKVRIEIVP